jgi:hypothetical protein
MPLSGWPSRPVLIDVRSDMAENQLDVFKIIMIKRVGDRVAKDLSERLCIRRDSIGSNDMISIFLELSG